MFRFAQHDSAIYENSSKKSGRYVRNRCVGSRSISKRDLQVRSVRSENRQRCFASLNMTALFMRTVLRNLVATFAIAALGPAALANETYKFDPSDRRIDRDVSLRST